MRTSRPNIDEFYASISAGLLRQEVPCAITGGLACVEFGVAQHTEDCDLICPPAHAETLLEVLRASPFGAVPCQYRKTSPPLDVRWLAGGYTAHFLWPTDATEKPSLDVFGAPPRVSTPWERETVGRFAGRHTVAEMKRTNRRKDWDQATALGLAMLQANDRRGWLHIFDAATLRTLIEEFSPGGEEIRKRPALQLAISKSPLLDRAVQTEIEFWTHLNTLRLQVYQASHDRYARALLKAPKRTPTDLLSQHRLRVEFAERLLPDRPLQAYGIPRLIDEAKEATAMGLDPTILRFLPEVTSHFGNVADIR